MYRHDYFNKCFIRIFLSYDTCTASIIMCENKIICHVSVHIRPKDFFGKNYVGVTCLENVHFMISILFLLQ